MERSLATIAREIRTDWKPVSQHAEPYLRAMFSLSRITDPYYLDSGLIVVLYFLSNASAWRGDKAKAIKAELKTMVKSTGYKL
jgi:hypothetical protein